MSPKKCLNEKNTQGDACRVGPVRVITWAKSAVQATILKHFMSSSICLLCDNDFMRNFYGLCIDYLIMLDKACKKRWELLDCILNCFN